MKKRGKQQYTLEEAYKVLTQITADLQAKCDDNEILRARKEILHCL
jgi:hypothetical protein